MKIRPALGLLRRAIFNYIAETFSFLRKASGVIHVGANIGQERDLYARHNLRVLWIEPLPDVFARLQTNLRDYPKQRALQYLVTDQDGARCTFHISSNDGVSSSILDLGLHRELWPEVSYTGAIELQSVTLSTLLRQEQIDVREFDTLVLDTQGSELLVLRGAVDLLRGFRFILTEAADFEVYNGCCTLADLSSFLLSYGFRERWRKETNSKPGIGACYDVLYERRV